jgi:hypothetical protein
MTPVEKANELIDKYSKIKNVVFTVIKEKMVLNIAKQSALIAVDEILAQNKIPIISHKISAYKTFEDFNDNLTEIKNQMDHFSIKNYAYWSEVKKEIEKL